MNKDQVNTAEWLRRGAAAVAAGRVGLGLAALARPAVVTGRPWVGPSGEGQAGRVLGRALGARDLALGLGTLAALQRPAGPDTDQPTQSWVALSGAALSGAALQGSTVVGGSVRSGRRVDLRSRWARGARCPPGSAG